MKIEFPFIAVDWGVSRMRAMLCESATPGQARKIEGRGISKLSSSPATTLFDAIEPWVNEFGRIDLLLGGMVGSDIGWRKAPYLPCPVALESLTEKLTSFSESGHRIGIVAGVECVNALGQPDVMRGEEIQVQGWAGLKANTNEALICLPGTHTKWVRYRIGQIESFTTSLTGEMYAALSRNSVLISAAASESPTMDATAFTAGVQAVIEHDGQLMHLLFSTRSRQLLGSLSLEEAPSYLSGLIIGADVRSALRPGFGQNLNVQIIGAPGLCERYKLALDLMGHASATFDGDDMVVAGFLKIAEALQ